MRFVVLSMGRSGNNMLRSALTHHPRVSCQDEVLSAEYNFAHLSRYWSLNSEQVSACRQQLAANPVEFLARYVFASPDPERDTFGFRLFYQHCLSGSQAAAWEWMNSQPDIRIIHLERRNRLRQLVSLRTAMGTLEWTRTKPSDVPPPQVSISPKHLIEFARRCDSQRDAALARLGNLPRVDITYEDLVADFDARIESIQSFIGVERLPLAPATLRQGGQPLEDRISNIESLRAALRETPYAWMLDDEEDKSRAVRVLPSRQGTAARQCTRLIAQTSTLDLDILPHWVRHYRSLGVKNFHLILHGSGIKLLRLRHACRRLGLTIEGECDGRFSDEEKRVRQQAIVRRFHGEWLLLVDMDELLELPYRDIPTTIRALEVFGATALPAILVQRVAADGSLPGVSSGTNLERTFPLASTLLSELMGSHTIARSKFPLFLASEDSRVQLGQHQQPNSDASSYVPVCAVLHHYKWRSRLRLDLAERSKNAHISYLESRAYLDWLEEHHGRVPLDGAFDSGTAALVERGLLRRPNRTEIMFGALLHRLRRSRSPQYSSSSRVRLNARVQRAETGMEAHRSDRALPVSKQAGRAGRIAIVTFELLIPDRSGGIGTWCANLALSLQAAGHSVTIFYAKRWHGDSSWASRYWKANNVKLVPLSMDERRPFAEDALHNLACIALEALAARTWDVIHVPDAGALAWQIVAARRAGLAFKGATIVVTLHGNSWWHRTSNGFSIAPVDVELNHLETNQVRDADVVVAPSAYMLDYMDRTYPGLVKAGFVQQNPVPWPLAQGGKTSRRQIKEFVFFGRLEARKGLWTFCEAVSDLLGAGQTGFSVTFLGAFGSAESRQELLERIKKWPSVRLIEHFHVEECRLYLSDPTRIAVMPSNGDNSPYTILECVANGIPFLASRSGGIPELILTEDQEYVLVGHGPVVLAAAMLRCLAEGAVVARPAIPPRLSELRLLLWHEHLLAAARRDAEPAAGNTRSLPPISVCIAPRASGGRDFTMDWIRSPGVDTEILLAEGQLAEKTAMHIDQFQKASTHYRLAYQAVEGSRSNAQAYLNLLAARARNEIMVFADAAIRPDPASVQMIARVFAESEAAALTAHIRLELMRNGKPMQSLPSFRLMSSVTPGLARLKNVFGAPVFAVRKEVFARLGGFNESPACSRAWHWEWLARLIECGERVEALPFCFGSWQVDVSQIDRDWPWGSLPTFSHIADERLTIERRHLQMLQGYVGHNMPDLVRVQQALSQISTGRKRVSLLQLKGRDLATLNPFKNTRLSQTQDGVMVGSSDDDPKVRLPVIIGAAKVRDLVVEISVRVPNEGNLKVYWRNGKRGNRFAEDRSVARYLLPGENSISLRVPSPTFPVSLRLDPGESPGSYLVRSIAVFGD